MKLSVCMITYNHEKYIAQAIESALMQQTDFDYELVIGDDCSRDGTRKIIEEYHRKFPGKVRLLLPSSNLGVMKNFVATVDACRGEYIAWLEGDDYWVDENKLAKQVALLDAEKNAVYSFSDAVHVDEDGNYLKDAVVDFPKKYLTEKDLLTGFWTPSLTTVHRKKELQEVLSRMSTDKPIFNPDWIMFTLLAEKGPIAYVKTRPSAYRQHAGGVFSKKTIEHKLVNSLKSLAYLRGLVKKENVKQTDLALIRLYNNYLYGLKGNKQRLAFLFTEMKLQLLLAKKFRGRLMIRAFRDFIFIIKSGRK
jgi:glycosyltransferase involved in cell wall biosynthesis